MQKTGNVENSTDKLAEDRTERGTKNLYASYIETAARPALS